MESPEHDLDLSREARQLKIVRLIDRLMCARCGSCAACPCKAPREVLENLREQLLLQARRRRSPR